MSSPSLLTRLILDFRARSADSHVKEGDDSHPSRDLSAVCVDAQGHLWLSGDEGSSIDRLTPVDAQRFANHRRFALSDFIPLPKGNEEDDDPEVDIEGLAMAGGYLWIAGSHAAKRRKPKGKDAETNARRLATVRAERGRDVLARIPLVDGELCTTAKDAKGKVLRAAVLKEETTALGLRSLLKDDPHFGAFLRAGIPGKDNGFDIEGLCVEGDVVHLGLRGPVLRGHACILSLKVHEPTPGALAFAPWKDGQLVHKTFLDLDGLGIRDMRLHDGSLLLLAGPTMVLDGAIRLFRLTDARDLRDAFVPREPGRIERLLDIPHHVGADRAEGMAWFPWNGIEEAVLVVFDSPSPARLLSDREVLADVWRVPPKAPSPSR